MAFDWPQQRQPSVRFPTWDFVMGLYRSSLVRGTTLISMTRSRNDGMTGFKGLFLRPIISRRSREGVRRYLVHLKEQVERPADSGF
jgi:hypothetical protein